MARYIDADKLLEELQEEIDFESLMYTKEQNEWFNKGLKCAVRDVKHQPTADVVEVKHGEWIYNTDDFTPKERCSVCGYNKPLVAGERIKKEPNDYCNKCGAKMDGERSDT